MKKMRKSAALLCAAVGLSTAMALCELNDCEL